MNLKVPRAIISLGWAFLSTRAKTVWGVVATLLRRTRDKKIKRACYFSGTKAKTGLWFNVMIGIDYLHILKHIQASLVKGCGPQGP